MVITDRSRVGHLFAIALVAMLLTACGASPAGSPATSVESSVASLAPSIAASASPSAQQIKVNSAPLGAPLAVAWQKGGTAMKPCTANPVIAPDGRIWVAACWQNAFWIFDPDGNFLEAWGTTGSGHGQFNFAYAAGQDAMGGAVFASDGSFYTFEAGNARVQHFSADRAFLGTWGSFGTGQGQFAKPTSIGIDGQDRVYVGDGARHDVQVFASDGTFMRSIGKDIAGVPNGFVYMAVDRSGNVFLDHGDGLVKLASDGTELAIYDVSAIAADTAGMAIGEAGHLFVSGYSKNGQPVATFELDADGQVLHAWPQTGETLVVDEANHALYAAFRGWDFIRRYTLKVE